MVFARDEGQTIAWRAGQLWRLSALGRAARHGAYSVGDRQALGPVKRVSGSFSSCPLGLCNGSPRLLVPVARTALQVGEPLVFEVRASRRCHVRSDGSWPFIQYVHTVCPSYAPYSVLLR